MTGWHHGISFLLKSIIFCMALSAAGLSTAEAACGRDGERLCKIGFKCKKGLAPVGNVCRPCGGKNQVACEAARLGKRCKKGLKRDANGYCRAAARLGTNGQPPRPKAPLRFQCDAGLAVDRGLCRPCGKLNQMHCPPARKGKQCADGLKKDAKGYCRRAAKLGTNGQPPRPKSPVRFQCDKGLAVDRGLCRPCGGRNQIACPNLRKGERCGPNLAKDGNGYCRPCGGPGQHSCPVIKKGTICQPGYGKFDGVCRPCGKLNQRACPARERGRQCEEWTTNRKGKGFCRPCGTPSTGACRLPDKGKPCRPIYDWRVGGKCVETVRSRTRAAAATKLGNMDPKTILNTVNVARQLNQNESLKRSIKNGEQPEIGDIPSDDICEGKHKSWTLGISAGAGAGIGVVGVGAEGEAGAAFRCKRRPNQLDTKWYVSGSWTRPVGGDVNAVLTLGIWTAPYNNLGGKSHGYEIGLTDIASLHPKVAKALKGLNYKALGPDASIGFWFERKQDNSVGPYIGFTVSLGAAAGMSFGQYLKTATSQTCTYATDCGEFEWRQVDGNGELMSPVNGTTIYIWDRQKEGIEVTIVKPGEEPRAYMKGAGDDAYTFERSRRTSKRAYDRKVDGTVVERICLRKNATVLKYSEGSGDCDDGMTLKVAGALPPEVEPIGSSRTAQRTVRVRSNGASAQGTVRNQAGRPAAGGGDVLGSWVFDLKGRTLTDKIIKQTDGYIIAKRGKKVRRYDYTANKTYRHKNGATYRFVTDRRGIWVSANKKRVLKLSRQ